MSRTITTARGDVIAYDHHLAAHPRGADVATVFIAGAGPFRAVDPLTTETGERLARAGIDALVFDRTGRGESVAASGDPLLDLDRELEVIRAVVDVADAPAVLCGHSSGATLALAAASAGVPVAGVVTWEAPLHGFTGGATAWAAEFTRLLDAGERERALEQYMVDMPAEWLESVRQSPEFPMTVAQTPTLRADAASLAWADSAPLPELLGGIRAPVLALAGTETFPGMVDAAEEIAAAAPDGRADRVAGADHAWEPAAMAERLATFAREAVRVRA
ncbi:alpha/beta fold hydrolase [Agromyces sp. ZXT2-6]|uniref:alpha/beta fold hydrolase n=1 Tax=Agromyces sp. ZXT2-6 TaxID=3461153 RepID=UPI004054E1F8